MLRSKNLQLRLEVCENIPDCLFGDDIRLRQIVTNLLTNAVKYTQKGSVTLKADFEKKSEDEIFLSIEVRDTGIGIRKEDHEKLFESFRRLDEEKNRNIEGTGLGMNITKQLIAMMDGIETVHRMRNMEENPCKDTPVIILTANAVTGAREEYLKEGFTDFLAKPIDSTHLEKMLCTYLPKELLEEGIPQEHQDSSKKEDTLSKDILSVFCVTRKAKIQKIEQAWKEKDIKAYTIEVHALKSAAAVVGAVNWKF